MWRLAKSWDVYCAISEQKKCWQVFDRPGRSLAGYLHSRSHAACSSENIWDVDWIYGCQVLSQHPQLTEQLVKGDDLDVLAGVAKDLEAALAALFGW